MATSGEVLFLSHVSEDCAARMPHNLLRLALVASFSICFCSESFGQSSELFVNKTAFCFVDPRSVEPREECPPDKAFKDGDNIQISKLLPTTYKRKTYRTIYFWGNVNRSVQEKKEVKFLFARIGGDCYEQAKKPKDISEDVEEKLLKCIDEATARKLRESVGWERWIKSGQAVEDLTPAGQLLLVIADTVAARVAKLPNKSVSAIAKVIKEYSPYVKWLPVILSIGGKDNKDVNISDYRFVTGEGEVAARIYDSKLEALAGHNKVMSIRITE